MTETCTVKRAVYEHAKRLYESEYGESKGMELCERIAWAQTFRMIDQMMARPERLSMFRWIAPLILYWKALTLNNISWQTIRITAVAINFVLMKMYQKGIHITASDAQLLIDAATTAAKTKTSLILLPCHKSHIDYLVISYLLFRLNIAIPHVVAGDNLSMPLVGNLMRNAGAFFIRRQWGSDKLYTSVMKEYIEACISCLFISRKPTNKWIGSPKERNEHWSLHRRRKITNWESTSAKIRYSKDDFGFCLIEGSKRCCDCSNEYWIWQGLTAGNHFSLETVDADK